MKVGLMGLGGGGQLLAEALLASSWCELTAVASRQPKRSEQFRGDHPGITAYDDCRSLIVENPLDALFMAVPPFFRGKYLTLAAEHGLPVFMLTPPARRFDEALEIGGKFEQAQCAVVVARSWGIAPALQPDVLGVDELGGFFFARGNVMTCLPDDLDWRGDSVRAGGGVLLDRGYALIDIVVQVMGLPSSVQAAARRVSRPGGRFAYDTEDTAALVCEFRGGAIAVISACWSSGPERWELELHGTGGSVHLDRDHVVCRDRTGETQLREQSRPVNPFSPLIEDFLSTLSSNPANVRSSIREHLPAMAVVQAAYLSARTGQPESPSTIFEMHDVKEATSRDTRSAS